MTMRQKKPTSLVCALQVYPCARVYGGCDLSDGVQVQLCCQVRGETVPGPYPWVLVGGPHPSVNVLSCVGHRMKYLTADHNSLFMKVG